MVIGLSGFSMNSHALSLTPTHTITDLQKQVVGKVKSSMAQIENTYPFAQ